MKKKWKKITHTPQFFFSSLSLIKFQPSNVLVWTISCPALALYFLIEEEGRINNATETCQEGDDLTHQCYFWAFAGASRRVASRSFVCACVVCGVYKMRAFVIFVQEEAANFFFGFDLCFYFFLMHLYTMPCMLHHTCCNYCGRTTTPPRPCIILMIEKIEGTYLVVWRH